jgi:hypothetical protein
MRFGDFNVTKGNRNEIIIEMTEEANLLLSFRVNGETNTSDSGRALEPITKSAFPAEMGAIILKISCG